MSRSYDYKINLNSVSGYSPGDSIGSTNGRILATVTAVLNNDIYIVLGPNSAVPRIGETIGVISSNFNRSKQDPNETAPFDTRQQTNISLSHSQFVRTIDRNKIFAEYGKLEQEVPIRLFTLVFPGEIYQFDKEVPSNGYDWQHDFPIRWAEPISGLEGNYSVISNGKEYPVIPFDITSISEKEDGSVGQVTLSVFNQNDFVSALIENPNLGGYSTDGVTVTKDGESVKGIDPRTVPGSGEYDSSVVDAHYDGKDNSAISYEQAQSNNWNWTKIKEDSRDLLGAVVKITTTYVKYLDRWPEFSTITSRSDNNLELTVENSTYYRVGDKVIVDSSPSAILTITAISGNVITVNTAASDIGNILYIINEEASPFDGSNRYFKISQLRALAGDSAEFILSDWMDYFNNKIPRSRYHKNLCRFKYKDGRCGYPGPGGLPIQGADKTSNAHPVTLTNGTSTKTSDDVCAKTLEACLVRNNAHRFGGFIATGTS